MKRSTCANHGTQPGYCHLRVNRVCPYHKGNGICSVDCDLDGKGKAKTRYESETEQFTLYQNMNGVAPKFS